MHVRAKLTNYDKLDFSMTLTASVGDWRAVLKQLDQVKEDGWVAWPLSSLYGAIDKMIADLDKTHWDVLCKEDQSTPA